MEEQEKIHLLPPNLHYSGENFSAAAGGRELTDLRNVGRCRDGEGVSVESEGDIRHVPDVLAVHCSLSEEHHTQS